VKTDGASAALGELALAELALPCRGACQHETPTLVVVIVVVVVVATAVSCVCVPYRVSLSLARWGWDERR